MKDLLFEISKKAIKYEDFHFTPEQMDNNWLGNLPAVEKQLVEIERKLGIKLPDDYKAFLSITNGFSAPNDIEPSFEKVENIDFLKNVDEFVIEAYSEVYNDELAESIIIGGINQEQYFLLIPPKTENGEWMYWKFANWIPGEHAFKNLKEYFEDVLLFLIQTHEK